MESSINRLESVNMTERSEALMRIVVGIVSGIILGLWGHLVCALSVINWLIAIFADKRNKDIAEFSSIWTANVYEFIQYMTFMTNTRVFPFTALAKPMAKYEK